MEEEDLELGKFSVILGWILEPTVIQAFEATSDEIDEATCWIL